MDHAHTPSDLFVVERRRRKRELRDALLLLNVKNEPPSAVCSVHTLAQEICSPLSHREIYILINSAPQTPT
jgi:hypothetical protein